MRLPMIALGLALLPGLATAEGSRRYGSDGRYLGRFERSGDTTRFYDAAGRYRGRAEAQGSSVRRYDERGRYVGRQERQSPNRR